MCSFHWPNTVAPALLFCYFQLWAGLTEEGPHLGAFQPPVEPVPGPILGIVPRFRPSQRAVRDLLRGLWVNESVSFPFSFFLCPFLGEKMDTLSLETQFSWLDRKDASHFCGATVSQQDFERNFCCLWYQWNCKSNRNSDDLEKRGQSPRITPPQQNQLFLHLGVLCQPLAGGTYNFLALFLSWAYKTGRGSEEEITLPLPSSESQPF